MTDQETAAFNSTVFARVVDGLIVEYPVFGIHITNRAHPVEWYTEVYFEDKPALPPFCNYQETRRVVRGQVFASYTVVPDSLDSILADLHRSDDHMAMPGEATEKVVDFASVLPATVQQIVNLSRAMAQQRLDAWATEKHYDNILSAASYVGSMFPDFAADGAKAVQARDGTWLALYNYMEKVSSGELPVPKSSSDIVAQLPELSWA